MDLETGMEYGNLVLLIDKQIQIILDQESNWKIKKKIGVYGVYGVLRRRMKQFKYIINTVSTSGIFCLP